MRAQAATQEEALGEEMSARDLAETRMAAYREIAERIQRVQWSFDPGELTVDINRGRLVVELPNRVIFAPGEIAMSPMGTQAVRDIATILRTLEGRQFLVAGHTDDTPEAKKTPRFNSNWELAAMRAIAVTQLLVREGVDPRQLGAVSYGQHHPATPNTSEQARARNRRIEIMIMPTADEIVPLPDEIGGEPG